jgi:hypothetical protein
MTNVDLDGPLALSPFRHIALGTWAAARDPSIHGSVAIAMDEAMHYIDAFRLATGRRLTVTHLMAKVAGVVLDRVPELNVLLRWGRLYRRRSIAAFFQVAIEDASTGAIDLSGVRIEDPQRKALLEIIDEFEMRVADARARRSGELERSRTLLHRVPGLFLRPALRLLAALAYGLNVDMRWAGVPRDPFGSVMVTNVGSLGLDQAYAPLVPFSRVPTVVAMGSVQDEPRVVDGRIAIAKVMRLFATFDHRVVDGVHAAKAVAILREWLEHPFDHFDRIEAMAPSDVPRLRASSPG